MNKDLIKLLYHHKGLFIYTVLNYIDKFLNFFTPFLILKLQGINYTEIEYLISISLIFSSFSDIGLRQYFFYCFKISDDRDRTLKNCQQTKSSIVTFYSLLGLLGFCLDSYILVLYGVFKGIFQTYINLESTISRLQDNPNKVLWMNMAVNLCIIAIFIVFHTNDRIFKPFDYTSIYIFFCIVVCLNFFIPFINKKAETKKRFSVRQRVIICIRMLIGSVKFAYPTIVILVINGIETNLSKVYGYDTLDEESYRYMVVLLRFFSILILAHASLIGYKSKQIYLSMGGVKSKDILMQITFVTSAYVLMIAMIVLSNYINLLNIEVQFNSIFVIVSITYLCMICRAFLEPYFAKHNQLHLLMFPSIISLTTIVMMFLGLKDELNNLSVLLGIIMIGEILSTSIVLIFYKLKIHAL